MSTPDTHFLRPLDPELANLPTDEVLKMAKEVRQERLSVVGELRERELVLVDEIVRVRSRDDDPAFAGRPISSVARDLGISYQAQGEALERLWRDHHIRFSLDTRRVLTEQDELDIAERYWVDGVAMHLLAKEYGVAPATIRVVVTRHKSRFVRRRSGSSSPALTRANRENAKKRSARRRAAQGE